MCMEELLYKVDKTKEDIDQLLDIHKNLVYFVLGKMKQLYNPDAESAAWEALWYAIVTFDIFSSTAFSTYAYVVIRNAVNNELRKYYYKKQPKHIYTDEPLCQIDLTPDADLSYTCSHILLLFDEYILDKHGQVKDILLAWYTSDFEGTPTNIAKICGCAPTNVSRVQATFRAFITRRLKEL